MVYHLASALVSWVSSRMTLGLPGAMSAMPISSGISSLWRFSMSKRLAADNRGDRARERVVEDAHHERDDCRDQDDHERMRSGLPCRRPVDVGELFADVSE